MSTGIKIQEVIFQKYCIVKIQGYFDTVIAKRLVSK